jgi:hypothetical protein
MYISGREGKDGCKSGRIHKNSFHQQIKHLNSLNHSGVKITGRTQQINAADLKRLWKKTAFMCNIQG